MRFRLGARHQCRPKPCMTPARLPQPLLGTMNARYPAAAISANALVHDWSHIGHGRIETGASGPNEMHLDAERARTKRAQTREANADETSLKRFDSHLPHGDLSTKVVLRSADWI